MIDDLLSTERIEPLAPEPDAMEAAWAEVGRRRRARARRTQIATGLGLVMVVGVALLPSLGQETKMAKLDVAGREQARQVEAEAPIDVVEPDDADPASSGIGTGVKPPGRSGSSEPQTAAPRTGSPAPPRASRPSKPPVERTRRNATLVGCVADWCMSASAGKVDENYSLAMDICVPVGTRARRFSFATTQEVDLTVSSGNSSNRPKVWTWSLGQAFRSNEHHVDISAGECVTWSTVWDGTDEAGNGLEPGSYRLDVRSLADQAADRTAAATFQIS